MIPDEPSITLEYAADDYLAAGELVVMFWYLLMVAVLSGVCIASCFLVIGGVTLGSVMHAAVYATILCFAVLSGKRMTWAAGRFPCLQSSARMTLDIVASIGLVIIGFGPVAAYVLFFFLHSYVGPVQNALTGGLPLLAIAFGLLAATSFRHVLQYKALADVMAGVGRRRGALETLGWLKFIFETAWLGCCALSLLGTSPGFQVSQQFRQSIELCPFGALFGIPVYGLLWIAMIVAHARCLRTIRKMAKVGILPLSSPSAANAFEVVPVESVASVHGLERSPEGTAGL